MLVKKLKVSVRNPLLAYLLVLLTKLIACGLDFGTLAFVRKVTVSEKDSPLAYLLVFLTKRSSTMIRAPQSFLQHQSTDARLHKGENIACRTTNETPLLFNPFSPNVVADNSSNPSCFHSTDIIFTTQLWKPIDLTLLHQISYFLFSAKRGKTYQSSSAYINFYFRTSFFLY